MTAMQKLALIAAFGAIGAVARYLTNVTCIRLLGERFAFGTLAVNVVGCFLIGLLMYLSVHHPRLMSEGTHAAISTGFVGALTTFSTFGYETLHYLETDRAIMAGLNVVANLSLGLLAAWCGAQLGRMWG
jgi:CrcB protein